jgi:hypothetical protein
MAILTLQLPEWDLDVDAVRHCCTAKFSHEVFSTKKDFLWSILRLKESDLIGSELAFSLEVAFSVEIYTILEDVAIGIQRMRDGGGYRGTANSEQEAGILSIVEGAQQKLLHCGFILAKREILLLAVALRIYDEIRNYAQWPSEERFAVALWWLKDDLAFYTLVSNRLTRPALSPVDTSSPDSQYYRGYDVLNICIAQVCHAFTKKLKQQDSSSVELRDRGRSGDNLHDSDGKDSGPKQNHKRGGDHGHGPGGSGQTSFASSSARSNANPSGDGSYSWKVPMLKSMQGLNLNPSRHLPGLRTAGRLAQP